MKKVITLLLALVMVFAAASALAADIKVVVNGEAVEFDSAPQLSEGVVLVPFRFVAEKLGAVVAWDAETRTVFASLGEALSTMQIDNSNIFINGKAVAADKAPVIKENRTLVSAQVLKDALMADVIWDEATATVTVTK